MVQFPLVLLAEFPHINPLYKAFELDQKGWESNFGYYCENHLTEVTEIFSRLNDEEKEILRKALRWFPARLLSVQDRDLTTQSRVERIHHAGGAEYMLKLWSPNVGKVFSRYFFLFDHFTENRARLNSSAMV